MVHKTEKVMRKDEWSYGKAKYRMVQKKTEPDGNSENRLWVKSLNSKHKTCNLTGGNASHGGLLQHGTSDLGIKTLVTRTRRFCCEVGMHENGARR